jgi:hypothetical protein
VHMLLLLFKNHLLLFTLRRLPCAVRFASAVYVWDSVGGFYHGRRVHAIFSNGFSDYLYD